MFNPMAFGNSQQQAELSKMQVYTQHIRYVIHTEENGIEITLKTDNPEAAPLVPELQEGMVTCVTQLFYQMFGMEGERI